MGLTHISVDCRTSSDLNWDEIEAENDIWWNLNLGLFRELKLPLSSEVQVRSLGLALEHFTKKLWEKNAERTRGVTLFEGTLDLREEINWDKQEYFTWLEEHYITDTPQHLRLYCHTVAMDYLDILIGFLPEFLNPKIILDAASMENLFDYAQLCVNRNHEYLDVEIRNPPIQTQEDAEIGIVMPQELSFYSPLIAGALNELAQWQISYKIMNQRYLTDQWQGIEYLMVDGETICEQGMRRLLGFCAAGGTVVNLGQSPLGLDYECTYEEWKIQNINKISMV